MAQVQIDEAELLQYQKIAGAAQAIMADPEARKLHRAQKKVNPNARIPEVEIEERVESEVSGVRDEIAKLTKQISDERAERAAKEQESQITGQWEQQKRDLRSRGFTDDGIAKIEQHAIDQHIPNLRAAANDYLALNPPQSPEKPSGFGSWDFFSGQPEQEDTFVQKMIESKGDNEAVLNAEIGATLNEFRSQQPQRRY